MKIIRDVGKPKKKNAVIMVQAVVVAVKMEQAVIVQVQHHMVKLS